MLLDRFHRRKDRDDADSVIANLNYVLNTKKGFGSLLPDFGIGDYNEWKAREKIVKTLIREIKENVTKYEPRIRIEQIEEVKSGSPFRLRFQVKGVFLDQSKPIYIVVDSLRQNIQIEDE